MLTMTTRQMIRTIAILILLVGAGVPLLRASQAAPASAAKTPNSVVHAISGTVESVDHAAKTVSVKTADGTVDVVKVTEHTTVSGLKSGAKYTDLGAEKGAHVVVRYTGEGATKTGTGIDYFGKESEKVLKGTVVGVDNAAKTITVKTEKGTEEVVRVSDRATVDTGKGVAKGVEKGADVTVHFTERGGEKIAHLFKKL
jgi:arginine repressor